MQLKYKLTNQESLFVIFVTFLQIGIVNSSSGTFHRLFWKTKILHSPIHRDTHTLTSFFPEGSSSYNISQFDAFFDHQTGRKIEIMVADGTESVATKRLLLTLNFRDISSLGLPKPKNRLFKIEEEKGAWQASVEKANESGSYNELVESSLSSELEYNFEYISGKQV